MNSKQVIVVRKDVPMSIGKMSGQVAHACMGVFFDWMREFTIDIPLPDGSFIRQYTLSTHSESAVFNYIEGTFTKVVVEIANEDELRVLLEKASERGLLTSIITDSGRTEFSEPTTTCIAIGPMSDEDCIGLTDGLKLYQDDTARKLRSYEKLLRRIKQEKSFDNIKNIILDYENKNSTI